MKRTLQLLCVFLFCFTVTASINAQDELYFDEVFENVTVTDGVEYGVNLEVITGAPLAKSLLMDIYEPTGDTSTERPLVLMVHTGTFLPPVVNGGVTGTTKDSSIVEISRRLAKRGFLVAAIDYRQGWNPLALTKDDRVNGLINAAYRGVQDFRTAVRFFRKNSAEYGVDTDKIAGFGMGTGAYIVHGAATLFDEAQLNIPKFLILDPVTGDLVPMVLPPVSGDINGLGFPTETDTNVLNYPNHAGFSSDINFAFTAGGATADLSWITENSVPLAGVQVATDPNAPFLCDILLAPPDNEEIVEVCGLGEAIPVYNNLGMNNVLNEIVYDDVYTQAAENSIAELVANGTAFEPAAEYDQLAGQNHVFPMLRPYPHSAPWEWWDSDFWSQVPCPPNAPEGCPNMDFLAKLSHPDMSEELASAYIDTIMGFFLPRANYALSSIVGLEELSTINASISPNPSASNFNINVPEEIIQSIRVYDMTGSLVKEINGINANQYVLKGEEFNSGIYILNINTKDNSVGQKIVVE